MEKSIFHELDDYIYIGKADVINAEKLVIHVDYKDGPPIITTIDLKNISSLKTKLIPKEENAPTKSRST